MGVTIAIVGLKVLGSVSISLGFGMLMVKESQKITTNLVNKWIETTEKNYNEMSKKLK